MNRAQRGTSLIVFITQIDPTINRDRERQVQIRVNQTWYSRSKRDYNRGRRRRASMTIAQGSRRILKL